MTADISRSDCLPARIAAAGRHMDHGEWASGHAIAAALLRCARHGGGCPQRDDCAFAAELLLGDLRRMVAAA